METVEDEPNEKDAAKADSEDEIPDRGNWHGKCDYFLSLMGYAVGESETAACNDKVVNIS